MITSVDVTMYSPSNEARFEVCLDESSKDPLPSLTVTHVAEGQLSNVRHFLDREHLIRLRDLLNEKLPPHPRQVRAEHPPLPTELVEYGQNLKIPTD